MTTIIIDHYNNEKKVLTDREAILTLRHFDGSIYNLWFADPLAKNDEEFKRHCEAAAANENSTIISIKEAK